MILNTHPDDRKEMVKAISEHLGTSAQYMGIPTYAFTIGPLTVNRDGSISCEHPELLDSLRPMLTERGWLDAVTDGDTEPRDSSGIVETKEEDSEAPIEQDATQININIPMPDWTVSQLTNLLRTIYSKQHLLNRMMKGETIYVEQSFVEAITDNPPGDADDFKTRVQRAVEGECVRGLAFENGKLIFSTPYCPEEPTRWMIFDELLTGILKSARTASRVSIRQQNDPDNEKYHANSWLLRLGFGGIQHKELRRTLLHHLNGFAAFKSAADMEAHKERQAQRRWARREEAQQ